jgi:hypothetical protein
LRQFITSYLIISQHSPVAHLMSIDHCYSLVHVTTIYTDIWEVAVFVLGQGASYPGEGSHGFTESYQDHLEMVL